MNRTVLSGLAIAVLTGVVGHQVSALSSVVSPAIAPAGLDANDTHASASLLGQFRTSTATWLYLHADLYLHNGVEMRPLTENERQAGISGQAAATSDLGVGEGAGDVTVVPSAERDFRGWIGDLERACGAYKDMNGHRHNAPETTMPLFRLMTAVDPQFVPGWTMGAMILARDVRSGPDEAISFLKRGADQNPADFTMKFEIGYYLATGKKSPAEALPWLQQARALAQSKTVLSEDQKEALRDEYRILGLCLRDLNRPTDELAAVKEGIARFPDDPLLSRLMKAADSR